MDVNNGVVKFTRRVDSISVDCVLQEGEEEGPFDICRVKITAKALLWHQVSLALLYLCQQCQQFGPGAVLGGCAPAGG